MTSFQNMLQMSAAPLKAHSDEPGEVFNDSGDLLPGDASDLVRNGWLQFKECPRVVLIDPTLQESPKDSFLNVYWTNLNEFDEK